MELLRLTNLHTHSQLMQHMADYHFELTTAHGATPTSTLAPGAALPYS
jgi:hypothetical protein